MKKTDKTDKNKENKEKKEKKEKKENRHKGHRERLKNKLISTNGDGLEPHELLEIMLYYTLPQRNTNEIAHELLSIFGSVSAVLEADINDLIKVKWISTNTAALLKLQLALFRTYLQEKNDMKNRVLTSETLPGYVKSLFFGYKDEAMFAIMLDIDKKLISTVKLSEGTKYKAPIYSRELIRRAIEANADYVILAHNHPSGDVTPSSGDLHTTSVAEVALSYINVRLLDHVIVAGEKYTSIPGYMKRPKYVREEKEHIT